MLQSSNNNAESVHNLRLLLQSPFNNRNTQSSSEITLQNNTTI